MGWPIQAVLLLMRGIVPFMMMMPVLLIGYVLAIVVVVVAVAARERVCRYLRRSSVARPISNSDSMYWGHWCLP